VVDQSKKRILITDDDKTLGAEIASVRSADTDKRQSPKQAQLG
jgi:hypothetical protein